MSLKNSFFLFVFLFSGLLFTGVYCPFPALAAGTYTDSAHGSSEGVKRTDTHLSSAEYAIGNCAHCHEQHASIGGSEPDPVGGQPSPFLAFSGNPDIIPGCGEYSKSSNFCFGCHTSNSSYQVNMVDNYDYARTFAGYPVSPAGILETFNQDYCHNLHDISVFSQANFGWFKSDSNPCTACHNPHLAKPNRSDPDNPLLTALSMPSDHENLWGDDSLERFSSYISLSGSNYQAPYYYGSDNTYEPASATGGSAISDPALLPDYVTFCLDCHKHSFTRASDSTVVEMINWGASGDKHGKRDADIDLTLVGDPVVDINDPYQTITNSTSSTYVLSCLDCHEPHGSPFPWLTRQSINGASLASTIDAGKTNSRGNHCRQCHKDDSAFGGGGQINSWQQTHHMKGESPYVKSSPCSQAGCHISAPPPQPIPCENCHYHGGGVFDCNLTPPASRKTF